MKRKKSKKSKITWRSIVVGPDKILPTPNNFKLATEDGTSRFETSTDNYGVAGTIILNPHPTKPGYYYIIDGNSRFEKMKREGVKQINASVPSRPLTPKEYEEFSAVYDAARKGEVDIYRIKEELGTSKDFFAKWGFEIDDVAAARLDEMDNKSVKAKPKKGQALTPAVETRPISLLFTPDESDKYIDMAEKLYKRFKVDNVTDLSMKALAYLVKQKI